MTSLPALPFCLYRYLLITSYLGTKYHGSQRLTARGSTCKLPSIQESLETSLETCFPQQKCRLTAGSRTDKGVHALMNVFTLPLINYDTPTDRLRLILNQDLMKKNHDIIIKDILLAPSAFHPRRSCVSREYIYRIAVPKNHKTLHSLNLYKHRPHNICHLLPVTELYRSLPLPCLDIKKAQQVIDLLRGEHDFLSFCFSPRPDEDTVRTLDISMSLEQNPMFEHEHAGTFEIYQFKFKSRAFLYNQIRRMIGALITYATYDAIELDVIRNLIDNPSSSGWSPKLIIAEPYGLFLQKLNYNKSSFIGSKRTYDDHDDEEIDPENVEGSSDEILSDSQRESNARHESIMIENFMRKHSSDTKL